LKLGGLYVHQRRLRPALQVLKAATAAHPDHAELFAALGDVYRQLGLVSAAQSAGERAVAIEPARALWRFYLASTYERLDATQAQSEWRRYLELAQDDETEAPRLDFAHERLHELKKEEQ
jgi:uncharacterized protein HemY